jgi:hypothetical protein
LKFFIHTIKVTPEELSVHFTFSLPEPTLSSFLMVPRARSDAKRRQTDIVYREKMQEALVAGR